MFDVMYSQGISFSFQDVDSKHLE